MKNFLKTHTHLAVIIVAAVLLELTSGVLYYSAQRIIQSTMERLVQQEMNGVAMNIRKQLAKVEVAVNNCAWVVGNELDNPDRMFETTQNLLEHNPLMLGCGIAFVPNYYPQKGYWFAPYAVHRPDGTIAPMQMGSASHDYTQSEFYTFSMGQDSDHWSEPYLDSDGARSVVSTYSSPVHDGKGNVVAIMGADISLEWLKDLMDAPNSYQSTRRFLVSREYRLLAGEDGPLYRSALSRIMEDTTHRGYVTMTDAENGKQHVFCYPVGGITRWKLICVCSDDEIFGTLRHVRHMLLLLVFAGLLLVGFIVWRTSRNLERLRQVRAEKERIGGELRVAAQIQQSMLPAGYLRRDDVEICGSLVPAREVGGDLFDYFIRDEKLFFCIGDVSGKGVPSAMLMAVTHALFRSASAHESNPACIMHTINETSCQGNESNMFVTLFIGVLDLPTGNLRFCNAGHDAPFCLLSESQPVSLDCAAHLPVGVFADVRYEAQETHLAYGSLLFLYTDGLTEAKNSAHKQFGMERLQAALSSCGESPRAVLENIVQRVHRFVGDAEQSDDLTMLAIRYTPNRSDSASVETIVLKNDLHEVTRLGVFMKSVTEKTDIGRPVAQQLRLAVEEAVVNVINYAYPPGMEGSVEIRVMYDGRRFKILIIDAGAPFDPTAVKKADITLSAEERQIGGLGILLVREQMDSINYERQNGKNILTLVKNLK